MSLCSQVLLQLRGVHSTAGAGSSHVFHKAGGGEYAHPPRPRAMVRSAATAPSRPRWRFNHFVTADPNRVSKDETV